jgi:hypothetical protein
VRVLAVWGAVVAAAAVVPGGGTAVAAAGPEAGLAYHGAASMAGWGGWTYGSRRAMTDLPPCRTRP